MKARAIAVLTAFLLLVTGLVTSPTAAAFERDLPRGVMVIEKSRPGGKTFLVSVSVGTHVYLRFNRNETVRFLDTYGKANASATMAGLCYVMGGGAIGAVMCAGASYVILEAFGSGLRAFLRNHLNYCLTVRMKYLPWTASSLAYGERC